LLITILLDWHLSILKPVDTWLDVFQLIFMGSASSLDRCLGIIRYWLYPITSVKTESVKVVTLVLVWPNKSRLTLFFKSSSSRYVLASLTVVVHASDASLISSHFDLTKWAPSTDDFHSFAFLNRIYPVHTKSSFGDIVPLANINGSKQGHQTPTLSSISTRSLAYTSPPYNLFAIQSLRCQRSYSNLHLPFPTPCSSQECSFNNKYWCKLWSEWLSRISAALKKAWVLRTNLRIFERAAWWPDDLWCSSRWAVIQYMHATAEGSRLWCRLRSESKTELPNRDCPSS